MKKKITIDVVSDVVCPWCYIGKRRLEKAVDKLSSEYDFDVVYHPFELNPQMPENGVNQREYLSEKFGSEERYEQIIANTSNVATTEGLDFQFEKQSISPNTRKMHALLMLAKEEGKQLAIMEAFFKAYFTDGVDLSKSENLMSIATKAGLSQEGAERALEDESLLLHVSLAEQEMYKKGISAVPCYIINNKHLISGAQTSETFIEAFKEIGKDLVVAGEACDVNSKEC